MDARSYGVSYTKGTFRWERPALSAAQLAEQGSKGCDALMVVPILFPPDAAPTAAFESLDGRTGAALLPHDLFACWLALGKMLGDNKELDADRRRYARNVYLMALRVDEVLINAIQQNVGVAGGESDNWK